MRDLLRKLNDLFDRQTKQRLILATVISILVAMLDTAAIAMVLPLVDLATGAGTDSRAVEVVASAVGSDDEGTLMAVLTGAVVGLFILKDLGSMAFSWWVSGFLAFERVKTSARLLRHFTTSPYTEVSRRSSAELLRTMNESVTWLFANTVNGLMHSVTHSVAILAIIVALALIAPLPTLAVVVYFGLAGVVYSRVIKPRATAAGVAMTEASLVGWRTALAALGGIKELNIRGTQDHFVENYFRAARQAAQAGRVASFLNGIPRYILEILFILAVGLMLVASMAVPSTGVGGSVVGLLALFVAAGFRILPSVSGLLGNLSSIKVGGRALDLVHAEVTAAPRLAEISAEGGPKLPFREVLTVSDLSFRYPESAADVLVDVSLEVPRGTSVALVGGSGAGKTTLVDLILGLHDPRNGAVSVDGIPISDRKGRWQKNLGYVPQDVYILDATLAENIAFDQDREDIDEELLRAAVRKAQLDDVVSGLPAGLDTPVGEKGTRLSGGQRQRVGIARALYRQPALLVLDEATSALDNETESKISETIRALHGEVTVVIVAHRLSTVRLSDQIVFLKDGRVQTTGTFDEVRAKNAEFAHLVELGSLAPLDTTGDGAELTSDPQRLR